MSLSSKIARLGTETAFKVLAQAQALEAKGVDVVHLEIGEPDFDTPQNICDAATEALGKGHTHYCNSQGIVELRNVVAKETERTHGVSVDPARVVVTPGAKPIMFYSILALLEEGDEAIYPNPGFPIYESMINFVGAKAVPAPLVEERGFRYDIDDLRRKITDRTKMIIINSPENPTGGVLTREDLEQIAEIALENDIYVLSDEVYSQIIYDQEFFSIASLDGKSNDDSGYSPEHHDRLLGQGLPQHHGLHAGDLFMGECPSFCHDAAGDVCRMDYAERRILGIACRDGFVFLSLPGRQV